jgi:hypothetical protein
MYTTVDIFPTYKGKPRRWHKTVTPEMARAIQDTHRTERLRYRELAERYGVSVATVHRMVSLRWPQP